MLACQDGVEAFLDQALAGARDGGEAGVQRLHDAAIAPPLPIPRAIDDGTRESEKQLRINDGRH
jgi:hypothetical protein